MNAVENGTHLIKIIEILSDPTCLKAFDQNQKPIIPPILHNINSIDRIIDYKSRYIQITKIGDNYWSRPCELVAGGGQTNT